MESFVYGTDNHTVSAYGLDDLRIEKIVLKDDENKVDVTLEDCLYLFGIYASKMTGTIDGEDVSVITFDSQENTPEYYIGDFYFSLSEGIKAYTNEESRGALPDDAISLCVPLSTIEFSKTGNEWSIPHGTTVRFADYYDVVNKTLKY